MYEDRTETRLTVISTISHNVSIIKHFHNVSIIKHFQSKGKGWTNLSYCILYERNTSDCTKRLILCGDSQKKTYLCSAFQKQKLIFYKPNNLER